MKSRARFSPEAADNGEVSRAEVCNYMADMVLELRSMCKQNDLGYLSYLMEIVFIEATEQATRINAAERSLSDK